MTRIPIEQELEDFIIIGYKIISKIYEIPSEDLEFFNDFKSQILQDDEIINKLEKKVYLASAIYSRPFISIEELKEIMEKK